jgi:Holliday junction resolvase-like predicted endonuclease
VVLAFEIIFWIFWFTSQRIFVNIRSMHKFIRIAKQYVESHEYDSKQDFRLAAVIVRGGNVISVGYNKHNTNGFVEHYTDLKWMRF